MKNAYIINSKYYHVIDTKLKEITNDSIVTSFSLSESTINEILEDANYNSLFSKKRSIIVKDTPYFSSNTINDDIDKIISYLEHIDDNTTLVFITNELKNTNKNYLKIKPYINYIDCSFTNNLEVLKYIEDYTNNNHIEIEKNTLKILINNYQNNIDLIINELDKLSNLHIKIDNDVLNEYSFFYYEDQVFDFSNAIITKNFKEGFLLLEKLLDNKVEVSSLVGLLASSYTNLYLVKEAKEKGLTDEEVNTLLEYNNIKRVYVVNKNAKLYTTKQLEDIIKELSLVDLKIKTGYNPANTFKEFLLSI